MSDQLTVEATFDKEKLLRLAELFRYGTRLRKGQSLYTISAVIWSEKVTELHGTDRDCYNDDHKIDLFLEGLGLGKTWQGLVREIVREDMLEEEINHLLWEYTSFPLGGLERVTEDLKSYAADPVGHMKRCDAALEAAMAEPLEETSE